MSTFLLLAYVFFFLCSAVGIGALSLERLRFRSSDNLEFLTFAFGLGSAIHAAIFIGLGAVHLLYPSLIFLIYLLTAIITCGNCWRPSWRTALGQSLASMPSTFANVQTLLSLGFLLFLFVPLFPQLLLPTISWDATAYHLLLPVVYLARHNVDFVTWFPQTAFPMGWHALFGFGEVVGDGRVSNVITFLTIFIPSFYLWFSLRKRFGWVAVLLAFD